MGDVLRLVLGDDDDGPAACRGAGLGSDLPYDVDRRLVVNRLRGVETQTVEWYFAYLCGRPLKSSRRCILGRETALIPVEWSEDGWPRLAGGGNGPRTIVPAPEIS